MTESRTYEVSLVDAFTTEPLAGNAAGVVTDAADLTDEQMQSVARELSVSETAFILPSEEADRKLQYFTPTTEVDLCGHATIGSHARLFERGDIDAGIHTIETNVGVLDVEVTEEGTVWMTQNAPTVIEIDESYERVGEALGCDPNALRDVGADLPLARASTGLPFLVVPVNFLEQLGDVDLNAEAVSALADDHDAAGVYAFTFDTLDADATLHGRCFAPLAGISEDPVTGTASGACGAYLDHFAAFDEIPDVVLFEQGHYVDRPGIVRVRTGGGGTSSTDDDTQATGGGSPAVGGDAVTAFDGTIRVPTYDEDDIIEA